MSKYSALIKRATSATTALALSLASLTPAVMLGSRASAGQMTERKITVSDSDTGESATYAVSFKVSADTTVKAVFVDFCTSPIIGATCTKPTGLAVTAAGNQAIGNDVGPVTFTGALTNTDRGAKLTNASGESVTVGEVLSFNLTVTNPSSTGTYYARLLTYSDNTVNPTDIAPGAYIDGGGVALSATEDIQINARVQERLEFCVGTVESDAAAATACNQITGSVVDLGVLDTTGPSVTPVSSGTDGNNREGKILVSTNAFYGVKISYYSAASLRVGNGTCDAGDTSTTNQCINATATGSGAALANATEGFGMRVTEVTNHSVVTGESLLVANDNYDDATYKWVTGASSEIASTSSVVANDGATLTFGASPSATTPSGFYSTSANFVATGSF